MKFARRGQFFSVVKVQADCPTSSGAASASAQTLFMLPSEG